jgi:hypothetical protein
MIYLLFYTIKYIIKYVYFFLDYMLDNSEDDENNYNRIKFSIIIFFDTIPNIIKKTYRFIFKSR